MPKPKTPLATAGDAGDVGSIPGSGRFPWRRKWHPTPVFLSGEFHRLKSLAGYSSWGHKESDTIETNTFPENKEYRENNEQAWTFLDFVLL